MNDTLRFAIDLTNVERADNGREETYGGTYSLNGESFRAMGDDRSWNYRDEILVKIHDVCEAEWGDAPEQDEVLDALEAIESGTISIRRGGSEHFIIAIHD